jgi:hypothetical protein
VTFAFLAILANALISGWIPALASTPEQGLSIIICTSTGPTQLVIDSDGQPVHQQGQTHDHQCCPCGSARHFSPPTNVVALLLPANTEPTTISWTPAEGGFIAFVLAPHSPRAPPVRA